MTPQNRYHADFSDPAKTRIISILGRPPDITCTPKHACYVGGFVITIQQFTKESATTTERRYIYKNDSNESGNNLYITKIQKTAKAKVVSGYGQDSNWTKSPEDKRWRPNPCPGRAGGIPKLTSSDFKPVDCSVQNNPKRLGQVMEFT